MPPEVDWEAVATIWGEETAAWAEASFPLAAEVWLRDDDAA